MNITGTPDEIIQQIEQTHPGIRGVLLKARSYVEPSARAVAEYQAAWLYSVARSQNRIGARFLELGTAQGYSATILALAAPDAHITTLNPHHDEAAQARKNLTPFGERVEVLELKSWDFLESYEGEPFDLIFVDADHKNVRRDLSWFKHLRTGASFVFHDYSPNGTPRACPPVYRALLEFRETLERDFDTLVVDNEGVGMVEIIKQPGEDLDTESRDALALCHAHSSASYSYLLGLYELAQGLRLKDGQGVAGCVVECGAQNGGSAAALALGIGGDRKVWLFDNFTGVPKPSKADGEKAMLRFKDNPKGWAVGDKEQAREVFKQVGIKGMKAIEGEFAETFANDAYKTGKIAILHIDATLYASTKLALRRFYDHVADGGLVIVTAYHHWGGIQKAVDEFFEEHLTKLHTLEKGVYWTK